MRLLIHSPTAVGGLAEHSHYQARAFRAAGADVTVLCGREFVQKRRVDYSVAEVYRAMPQRPEDENRVQKFLRLARMVSTLLRTQWRFAWEVWRRRPDFVLMESYMEYLAPLWIWPHCFLAKFAGITFVANLHDPVRDFQVGPKWWHALSVQMGFLPLSIAVVHRHLPDRSIVPAHVEVIEAPVGVYDLAEIKTNPAMVRQEWQVASDSIVFLAFGFIRNNKNVDLLLRALAETPRAFLVVMGQAQSSGQKPLQFYRDLAAEIGVIARVRFREEFVPDEALPGYFAAADVIAITYNKYFYSQSGVLNLAAGARKPVLASSGDGPLKDAVTRFSLGEFVEPDNLEALIAGMEKLCTAADTWDATPAPDWNGYESYASWATNANVILEAVSQLRGKSGAGDRP
jgi:glycosyltransferase involved in cell wall biosynthesis